jgi:chromosome segregation ATPase
MNDITKFGLTPIPPASAKRPISQSFRSRNPSEERKSELHSAFYSIEEDIYEIQKVIDKFLNSMCEGESDIPRGKISSKKSIVPSVRSLASRMGNYSATVTQLRNGALLDVVFNLVSNVLGAKYVNLPNDMLLRLLALKAQMLEMLIKKIGELAVLKLSKNEEKSEAENKTVKVIIELCKLDHDDTRDSINDTIIENLQNQIKQMKVEYTHNYNTKVNAVEKESNELRERMKKLQDEIDKCITENRALKEIENQNRTLERRLRELVDIENDKKSLEQRLRDFENERKALERRLKELVEIENNKKAIEQKLREAETDKKALELKLNELVILQQEKKALESRLKEYRNLEAERKLLEQKLNEGINEKKDLMLKLKEASEDISKFMKLFKEKDQIILDLTRNLQDLQNTLHLKEQEFSNKLKEHQNLQSNKRRFSYCKYQVLNIPSRKDSQDRLLTKLSLENSEYLEKLQSYEKDIKDKIDAISHLQKELEPLKHAQAFKETFELELNSYKAANQNLKEIISQHQASLITAQAEIDRIKCETISRFDDKIRKYEAQISAHQGTENYYKTELKDFRLKLIEYKDIIESQILKIDSLEDTIKHLKTALEKADEALCSINSKHSAFDSYGDEDTFENVMKNELAMMRTHYEQKLQAQRSEISSLKQKFSQEMRRIQEQAITMDRQCKLYEVQMQSYLKVSK